MKNKHLFFLVTFVYFIIQIILRVFISDSLQTDEAEQILLFQYSWQWGYNTEPPLYTWMQICLFSIIENKILALSLLKNSLLFASIVGIFIMAQDIFENSAKAIIATSFIAIIPTISFETQRDLTHSVLLLFISVYTLLVIVKILHQKQTSVRLYVFLGVLVGLGGLSKYTYVIFVLALVIAVTLMKEVREKLYNKRIIISVAIAFLIVVGHGFWLYEHILQINLDGKIKQYQYYNWQSLLAIIKVILAAIYFCLPFLLVYGFIFRNHFPFCQKQILVNLSTTQRFLTLFYIVAIIIFCFLAISLNMTKFKQRWFIPILFSIPIYFLLFLQQNWQQQQKKVIAFSIAAAICISAILYGRIVFADYTKRYNKLNESYHSLVTKIQNKPDIIIGEHQLIAANLKLFFSQAISICPRINYPIEPQKNILIVWDAEDPRYFIPFVEEVLPNFDFTTAQPSTISCDYYYTKEKRKLYYLFITSY